MTPRSGRAAIVAVAVAVAAFSLYRATLLPGFDLGDTGSFQTIVGSANVTPRNGYPLYFALGSVCLWLTHADPAYLLNLLSAVTGAIACGIIVLVAARLGDSLPAALAAALLFAGSYTFWSQAIIAEVYALHILFVAVTLLCLLRWQEQPNLRRLAVFFAAYALGFGNHLSMILLFPGYALFILAASPGGWRSAVAPRVVALAVLFATAGAMQYVWNLRSLWAALQPPHGIGEGLQTFWFDVTKADWRETMMLSVPPSMFVDRVLMYAFDVRQQFGRAVPLLAALGLAGLFRSNWRIALLLVVVYAADLAFAFGYNVGDKHVFYLPSHVLVALAVAPGLQLAGGVVAALASRVRGIGAKDFSISLLSSLAIAYAAVRIYHDYPALDRSGDRRPTEIMMRLTDGIDDRRAILLTDLNWQVENGLSYFAKVVRPEVVHSRLPDLLLYAPVLVRDNQAIGRNVVLTDRACRELTSAYGPLLPATAEPRTIPASVSDLVRELPYGTRYALSVLKPTREFALDEAALRGALRLLTANVLTSIPGGDYAVVVGRSGEPPVLTVGSDRPFRRTLRLSGVGVEIRMESWLSADTIRRMGFGHVIAGRQHTMILERGVNFVAFDNSGRATRLAYAASIFAPQPRFVVRRIEWSGSPRP